ncbi:MAG: hypothetical protein LBU23_04870 [Planctomycetota bacterium]|jgi:nitrogenase molybdenum-iron protein beta chain|nr:hypothetical protein [Planctomycetota bacterium]
MTAALPLERPELVSAIERPRWTCALGGALAAAGALPGVVPIMHSGPGCAANFTWTQNGASGLQVAGACAGLSLPGSNLQESEVVFGGLDRLHEQIGNTLEIMAGDLYFVLTGCVPEVIGDDVESVVNEYAAAGRPVIFASTAGFKGSSYFGYEQVLKTLFRQVVRPGGGAARRKKLVNVLGVPPMMDVFWRGNLEGVRRLLALLGLEANVFFGPGASLDGIRDAARAGLNLVLSDVYGVEAAELFKELHGVDYLTIPLPFGAAASERFLRAVGQALRLPEKRVEAVIEAEGRRHYESLEPLIDVYNDMEAQRYAIVVGDANYAWAVTDFLAEDMGWLPELTVITDAFSGEARDAYVRRREARGLYRPERVLFETAAAAIIDAIDDSWRPELWKKHHNGRLPAFVAGSSLERPLAAALGAGHISLSFPVSNRAVITRGYTGYDGGLRLFEDVLSSIIAMR